MNDYRGYIRTAYVYVDKALRLLKKNPAQYNESIHTLQEILTKLQKIDDNYRTQEGTRIVVNELQGLSTESIVSELIKRATQREFQLDANCEVCKENVDRLVRHFEETDGMVNISLEADFIVDEQGKPVIRYHHLNVE